jgi:hypothetical protein
MGRLATLWGRRRQCVTPAISESSKADNYLETGRLSRLELVFLHTARAGAVPLRTFLEKYYGATLRTEYNSQPPQHSFEHGEIKYWVDWISRIMPNSGRAFAVNFLLQPLDVNYTVHPIRFVSLVREPIARIAGEFLAFRREVEARGDADAATHRLGGDIVHFADAMMRNDYLVRFFSNVDVCDPIDDTHLNRARGVLARLDIVGCHEHRQQFAQRVSSLDVFAGEEFSAAREAFVAEMSREFRAPGDELAAQLDAKVRHQLEQRNLRDLSLYRWISDELIYG